MSQAAKLRLAIVGSESLRGKEIKSIFSLKKFPLRSMDFYDPDVAEEYGKLTQFRDEPKVVHPLSRAGLEGLDLVFLAAGTAVSREYGKMAADGCFRAVDLSGTFGAAPEVPLIVVGVNDGLLWESRPPLIASPHPVTIFLSRLFHTLAGLGVARAVAVVLQPASAFEDDGIRELLDQSCALLSGSSLSKKVFRDQVAFNLLARTDKPAPDGFSPVEKQILGEIRKVLRRTDLSLSLSVVQVPVFHTYAIMAHIELGSDAGIRDLESLFRKSGGFTVALSASAGQVSPATVAGKDGIFIGQIKKEPELPRSFWIWLVADNLTAGSALNAFAIAEAMFPAAGRER